MSTESNKAIVLRYFEEAANTHQYDRVDEFMSEGIEFHHGGLHPGREALKQWLTTFVAAVPDYHVTVDDMVAEGDKVVVRVTTSGSHQGEFLLPDGQSIPATGNTVNFPTCFIFRVDNGKMTEAWTFGDNLVVMQQLGVIPA